MIFRNNFVFMLMRFIGVGLKLRADGVSWDDSVGRNTTDGFFLIWQFFNGIDGDLFM